MFRGANLSSVSPTPPPPIFHEDPEASSSSCDSSGHNNGLQFLQQCRLSRILPPYAATMPSNAITEVGSSSAIQRAAQSSAPSLPTVDEVQELVSKL